MLTLLINESNPLDGLFANSTTGGIGTVPDITVADDGQAVSVQSFTRAGGIITDSFVAGDVLHIGIGDGVNAPVCYVALSSASPAVGTMPINTAGMVALFAATVANQLSLTLAVVRTRGAYTNTIFSAPIVIRRSAINISTAVPTPSILGTGVAAALQVAINTALGFVRLDASARLPAVDASQLTNVPNELPSQTGNSGKYLTTNGTATSWGTVSTGLTVGTSAITGGTTTRVLFDNAGVLGEYAISGTGSVAMTTSPTFTTPDLGTPSALVGTNISGTASGLTAGNATLAATVTVANEATDTTCFPLFATAATGSLDAKSNAALTYNCTDQILGSTRFAIPRAASWIPSVKRFFLTTGNADSNPAVTLESDDGAFGGTYLILRAGSANAGYQTGYNIELDVTGARGVQCGGSLMLGTPGTVGGSLKINGLTSGSATISASATGVLALPSGTTATSMALTTPNCGTPSAIVLTNATGTAASLTAGTVTTNANLTGDVTSVGNATTLAAGSASALNSGTLAAARMANAGVHTGDATGTFPAITLNAAQTGITSVGTLTGGATGAGFTVALSTSTITGTLADARLSANVPLKDAANTFTNTQTLTNGFDSRNTNYVYLSYTDASNYQRLAISGSGITSQRAGTGAQFDFSLDCNSAYSLVFKTGGINRWYVSNSGQFNASSDNTYDIGQSGATRPRHLYVGSNGVFGGTLTIGDCTFTAGGGAGLQGPTYIAVSSDFRFTGGGSRIFSTSDGVIRLSNNDGTGFTRLNFGGTTSSFAALQTSGTGITAGLADGTAGGSFTASGTLDVTGATTLGAGTSIKNIRHGVSGAMVLGVVTVTDTGCTANTRYTFTQFTQGTVTAPSSYWASTRTASTSFVITSNQLTETGTVHWTAIEP